MGATSSMEKAASGQGPLRRIVGWLPAAWAAIDAEAQAERASLPPSAEADSRRARQLFVVGALLLALGYSFGDRPFFEQALAPRLLGKAARDRWGELASFTFWSMAKLLGYGLLPLLHVLLLGVRPADIGLGLSSRELPWRRTYLWLFACIFPVVALISRSASFQGMYPFYSQAGRSWFDLIAWEAQYLSTFVAVEFFFRGYLLFGLRRQLGSLAIFVSMLPYCLIHVLKPPAEALGSIFAGLLLGTLALRTGSIWCGVLLHVSVALSMDLLATWYGHHIPRHFWP